MKEVFLIQIELLFRIIIAAICGTIVGYERKNRSKEAGLRTHSIVAIGSALIMIISKYGFEDIGAHDGSRLASQVVSGIGFLGAGLIFVKNNKVSGLTTAAGIWTTSGIGLAIGAGMYYVGAIVSLIVVFIQIILHKEVFSRKDIYKENFNFVVKDDIPCITYIQDKLKDHKIEVLSIEMVKDKELINENCMKIKIQYIIPHNFEKMKLVKDFSQYDKIVSYKI